MGVKADANDVGSADINLWDFSTIQLGFSVRASLKPRSELIFYIFMPSRQVEVNRVKIVPRERMEVLNRNDGNLPEGEFIIPMTSSVFFQFSNRIRFQSRQESLNELDFDVSDQENCLLRRSSMALRDFKTMPCFANLRTKERYCARICCRCTTDGRSCNSS
ncbi:MAG: hypothetical protein RJB13_1898 [Pseudomonadota bacterium]